MIPVWLAAALRGDNRWVRVALHLVAIAGLVGTLLLVPVAEGFYTRGVATGRAWHPIPHTDVHRMGINTFLNEEPDPAVVERSLDMIRDGGYGYIRQIFGWYEIEPQPGVYVDAEGRSTWAKYDRIVDEATARGLQIIARLEKPPPWAKAGQPHPEIDGPPDRLSDYANFVEQVVTRYRGRLTYVQLWNEPNLEGEWGANPIDPRGYVELLAAGAEAARKANPDVVILLAGLAPTDQTGPANLSDLLFLDQVYELGGAAYFDIVSVMVYGYGYPPWDRRVSFERNNFSRPIQTREIMVRHGDEDTPVWAVEYGWVSLPDDWSGDPSPWGEPVSEAQQAVYLVDGYLRAQREWPWMGVMAVWAFRFPHAPDAPDQLGNPTQGFALVAHDFTPRPAYLALQQHADRIRASGTGSHQLTAAQQAQIAAGAPVDLVVAGERVDLLVSGAGQVERIVDGRLRETLAFSAEDGERTRVTVARGMRETAHTISLRISGQPDGPPPQVIGYVVSRIWFHSWIYPWLTGVLLLVLAGNVASLGWAVWDWWRASTDERSIVAEQKAHQCETDIVEIDSEGSDDEHDSARLTRSNHG
ncbi:MAG TPA: cellulase family glycosylhydrolase [Thermomicrobiales bacterium]|nr:cellulase family glycosylhydrolase [Thermomicrobiales bacterium]